jgi:hypothetical protein
MATGRSLKFDIGWDLNKKPLLKADQDTDRFRDKVLGLNSNLEQTGNAANVAGAKVSQSLGQARNTTNNLENEVESTNNQLKQTGILGTTVGSKLSNAFDSAKDSIKGAMSSGINQLKEMRHELGMATAVGSGIIFKTMKDASDLNETVNKLNVSFGKKLAPTIKNWGKQFADQVGRGRDDTLGWLGDTQDLVSSFSDNKKEAAKMSKQLVKLGVDLSSFQNKDTNKVLENLQSGLMGENQALKSLGIGITANQVKLEAYRTGIAKTGEELTRYQKMQATMNLMYDRSKNAIGDAKNTVNQFGNQLKFAIGNLRDISSTIGQQYLPAGRQMLQNTNDLFMAFKDNPRFAKFTAYAIAGTTAVLGLGTAIGFAGMAVPALYGGITTVAGALGLYTPAATAAKGATVGWNTALLANPAVQITAGVIALGAALYGIVTHWEEVKSVANKTWDTIELGAYRATGPIRDAWGWLMKFETQIKWTAGILGVVFAPAIGSAIYQLGIFASSAIVSGISGLASFGAQALTVAGASLASLGSSIAAIGSSLFWFAARAIVSGIAGLASLGATIWGAVTSVWALNAALLANPITWVVGSVIALGAAVYGLAKHWDTVTAKVKWFSDVTIDKLGALIGYVRKNPLESLLRITIPVVNLIEPINFAYEKTRGWLAAHTGLELPKFKIPSFPDLVGMAKNKVIELATWAKANPVQAVARFMIPGLNLIKPINMAYSKARGWLNENTGLELPEFKIPSVDKLFNKIESKIQWLKDKLNVLDLGGSIKDGITGTKDKAIGAVQGMTQKVRNFLPFSPAKEGPLSDLDKVGPGLVDTIGRGIDKARGKLDNTVWDMAKPELPGIKDVSEPESFAPSEFKFEDRASETVNKTDNYNNETKAESRTIISIGDINIDISQGGSVDSILMAIMPKLEGKIREKLEDLILESAVAEGVDISG